ncbi:hypodermin-A-like [Chrysoperla carnea]|uniref:hypodermin-A-like n=1 Tax=Chrysoperla carnea TaxID=189513 RepID=UPI001D088601|nr:hypodermin-A-like [Chrysoperla carnea]
MCFRRISLLFLNIGWISLGLSAYIDEFINPETNFISKTERYVWKKPTLNSPNDMLMYGGINTKIEEYPFVVQIFQRIRKVFHGEKIWIWDFICTGTILSESVIITAARCINDAQQYGIIAGETFCDNSSQSRTLDWSKNENFREIDKKSTRIHPLFGKDSDIEYNVSLLKLKVRLIYTDKIQNIKICHRDLEYWAKINKEEFVGEVVGWNWRKDQYCCPISEQLMKIQQKITPLEQCRKMFYEDSSGKDYLPTCTTFCGTEFKSQEYLCKSDSGAPFVFNNTLFGITTFFPHECDKDLNPLRTRYVLYARLSNVNLLTWLKEELNKLDQE